MTPKAGSPDLPALIAEVARDSYARGWMLGTSGNISAVIAREPLRLAISASGVDKGSLGPQHILEVDEKGSVIDGLGRPSAETLLHLAIIRTAGAGAVIHTHSVWTTILSDRYSSSGGVNIEGYEMLKGLRGVDTHQHSEWLPILDNSQDYGELSGAVERLLTRHNDSHGFLLRRHGLYTWGADLPEAKRHTEILEFLLEVRARTEFDAASQQSP
ncbi:MAG TPA: methylthioribulose 1-phosphate dehydratase [Blastocatellia bacterium]|nr:methylthioribulose 1-phosphate dehydratase [Blastocatellia bacterium]